MFGQPLSRNFGSNKNSGSRIEIRAQNLKSLAWNFGLEIKCLIGQTLGRNFGSNKNSGSKLETGIFIKNFRQNLYFLLPKIS